LAAIYVLREVARDFPDLSDPIFELLQAYLRDGNADYGNAEPPIDVREIIINPSNQTGEIRCLTAKIAQRGEFWIFTELSSGEPILAGRRSAAPTWPMLMPATRTFEVPISRGQSSAGQFCGVLI
jgi:hypothetical protein